MIDVIIVQQKLPIHQPPIKEDIPKYTKPIQEEMFQLKKRIFSRQAYTFHLMI